MPKPVSGKEKKQMLRDAREKKAARLVETQATSNEPKQDPSNFFLKFVNDSDQTVEENKVLASKPFSSESPTYVIDQTVYLREEHCPALPLRPKNAQDMSQIAYAAAEEKAFKDYFQSVSPDLQTIATQYCQFELNRNVYREVWRVTERSNVICLITDARFPLAHVPVSFLNFIKANKKSLILLINKIDLVSQTQVEQQTAFFRHYFGRKQLEAEVIPYSALKVTTDAGARIEFMQRIISAARRLSGIPQPECVTIGFCGQPSVGKSRTMNGLVGKQVTKVRLTAGCTKHLQTYYLYLQAKDEEPEEEEDKFGRHKAQHDKKARKLASQVNTPFPGETNRSVLLCDCPGLVLPVKNAPRPLQIVTGVFPTGRVREFYSPIRLLVEASPAFKQQVLELIDFQLIKARHHLEDSALNTETPDALLNCLAYQLNYTIKGGQPWAHKAGLWLLSKITEGTFVYEVPISSQVTEMTHFTDKWADAPRGRVVVDVSHLKAEIRSMEQEGRQEHEASQAEEAEEVEEQ